MDKVKSKEEIISEVFDRDEFCMADIPIMDYQKDAVYAAMETYATQQSRIEVAKVLEFLSNHKLDFQPASGGNFIGLNMEIYTPTEIDNLYLLSINKK